MKPERRHQHAGINVVRRIVHGEIVLDVAIVVGIDQPVGERRAQQALIGMAVGVDETRSQNAVAGIDDHGIGCDVRTDLVSLLPSANFRSFLQCGYIVPDIPASRSHRWRSRRPGGSSVSTMPPLDENTTRALQAGEIGVGLGGRTEGLRRRCARDERACGLQDFRREDLILEPRMNSLPAGFVVIIALGTCCSKGRMSLGSRSGLHYAKT